MRNHNVLQQVKLRTFERFSARCGLICLITNTCTNISNRVSSSKCFTIWSRPVASCRGKSRGQRKLKVALAPNKRLILAFHGVREKKSCWSVDFSLKFRGFRRFLISLPQSRELTILQRFSLEILSFLPVRQRKQNLRKITKFQRKIEGPTLLFFSYLMKSKNQPFIWCQCNF